MNEKQKVMIITGTSRGIGKYLAHYYVNNGYAVVGCSRTDFNSELLGYRHYCLDITDEHQVVKMFTEIRKAYNRLDVLINNAGITGTNLALLTSLKAAQYILNTNVIGTFLFCREAAKLMKKNNFGRIVNFATIATPLKIEGEAIYAASKAAVITLSHILAREFAPFNISVNIVGPTPIKTQAIRALNQDKLDSVIKLQAIHRLGEFVDVANVVDFFIHPASDFVTGQVIFLGGV